LQYLFCACYSHSMDAQSIKGRYHRDYRYSGLSVCRCGEPCNKHLVCYISSFGQRKKCSARLAYGYQFFIFDPRINTSIEVILKARYNFMEKT